MENLDYSINLLEELDNISKIHILERDDIDTMMIEFAKRIVRTMHIERMSVWLFNQEKNAIISMGEFDSRDKSFKKDSVLTKADFPKYFKSLEENKILIAPNIYNNEHTKEFSELYS
jgi:two-component system NtrC family sensor kinase